MDFSTILVFVTGLLAGVVAGLTVIAPRTVSKVDDKVLAAANAVLDALGRLGLSAPAQAPKPVVVPEASEAEAKV